jgi:hypothetical protein
MAYDLVKQLRGESGPRQVDGARIALLENGGGFIGLSAAALCMFVFESNG